MDEKEISRDVSEGECPFCGSNEIISDVVYCGPYGGYIESCEGYYDGFCKYCYQRDELSNDDLFLCPRCHQGYNFTEKTIIRDLFLHSFNPGYAFNYNVIKARALTKDFPEQAIIMIVSALEIYFRDKFIAILDSNSKFNYGSHVEKHYNFINIDTVNDIYKKYIDFNFKNLANNHNPLMWIRIKNFIAIRNTLVHNAGKIDKQALAQIRNIKTMQPLDVSFLNSAIPLSNKDAIDAIELVTQLVALIEPELITNYKIQKE